MFSLSKQGTETYEHKHKMDEFCLPLEITEQLKVSAQIRNNSHNVDNIEIGKESILSYISTIKEAVTGKSNCI